MRAAEGVAGEERSVVVRGDDACIDDVFHLWAQVYLPNYGWVPVDSSRGGKKIPVDRSRGFGELSNRYLITTEGGGASEYLDWDYNAFARYKMTGYAKVEEEKFALWEPLQATATTTAPSTTTMSGPGASGSNHCSRNSKVSKPAASNKVGQ